MLVIGMFKEDYAKANPNTYSGLTERLIVASWKGDGRENGTGVRIPHPLPNL